MERYANATAAEKTLFTKFSKIVKTSCTHIVEKARELTGDKGWVKFKFDPKPNNPHIHQMEFGVKKGEVANFRLVVSRPTLKSSFYKAMEKLGAKASYGGIVLHFDITEAEAPTLLAQIDKAAEECEIVELNPKRTYSDPPQGWVRGVDGKPAKIEAPEAEEIEAPTVEEEAEEEKAA